MAKSKTKTTKRRQRGNPRPPVKKKFEGSIPHYTTSLDAALPNENIISVSCEEASGKWIAIQKSSDGSYYIGVGPTEIAARRIAALQAFESMERRGENERISLKRTFEETHRALLQAITAIDELIDALENNNEYAANDPQEREQILTRLRAGRMLLDKAKDHPVLLAGCGFLVSAVVFVGYRFADTFIEKLSEIAFERLMAVFGA